MCWKDELFSFKQRKKGIYIRCHMSASQNKSGEKNHADIVP